MHREGEDSGPDPGHVEMMKSASERVNSGEREEEEGAVERRRPATAIGKGKTTSWGEDEEVDARADDFINRFKKQLKLQRMDSFSVTGICSEESLSKKLAFMVKNGCCTIK